NRPLRAPYARYAFPHVRPAKLWEYPNRHSRAGGNPDLSARKLIGYNGFLRFYVLDSRLRGNDGGAVSVFSDKFLKLKISSFPQKQKTKNRNLK
ncbi:LOW QUALITY PROTEIN: predicted protein, partial [Neisseria gonorrhoeae 35/02]